MTTPEDTMRAEFEAAMGRKGYEMNPTRFRDGSYTTAYYQAGWEMWQHQAAELERLRAQVAAPPLEWAGAVAFIQHAQNVAGAPGRWTDEFLAWNKPGDWFGDHRAAAVFLGQKLAAPSLTVGDVPAVVRTAPARIWLQVSDDASHMHCDFPRSTHGDEVTWSPTRALDCEVEYVRADLAQARPAAQAEPVTEVVNDYNADGKSARISEYLPAGTKLYTAPPSHQPAQGLESRSPASGRSTSRTTQPMKEQPLTDIATQKPKLFVLPASRAPKLMLPEEPKLPLQKTRVYDANGTEFVNLEEVMSSSDQLSPLDTIVTVRMRLRPGESMVLDAPPPTLAEALRALAAKWCEGNSGPSADRGNTAWEVARETCAEELEELLARWPLTPEAAAPR